MRPFLWLSVCIVLFGLTVEPARADGAWPARVGWLSGADTGASLRPAGGDWADAAINEPVAAGTALRSGAQGGAEIRLDTVAVTLAPSSSIDITALGEQALRITLKSGRVAVTLGKGNETSVEVDTESGAIKGATPGHYDIDAAAGLTAKTEGNAETLPDPLAGRGAWDGGVWYPKDTAADWAPFRDGRWRYLPPWGWTWIDAAAWGFASSHYGRWERIDGKWGWRRDADAAFAPATVAFLGTDGIGISYAGGSGPAVAWFPLAPGETYWPADKGPAPAAIADASYKYRRFATAIPRQAFTGGKPVAEAQQVDIPEARLDAAPVLPGTPGLPKPGPRLVVGLPHIAVAHAASRAAKPAPVPPPARIALDKRHRPHHVSPPTHLAVAPPKSDHGRPHLAEARHVLRQ